MPPQPQSDNPGQGLHDRLIPLKARLWVLAAVLVAAALVAHSPAIRAGYVWDDDLFLTENPLIKAGDGLYRFWFTTQPADYFPLTSTMLWIEWRLWGSNPMPYHAGNILLHAVAVVLLWRVLRRLALKEPTPYLAAMIFAVHPVTVASVAWVTERKNVLPMALYLLSILAYLRFDEEGTRRWYVFALAAGVAALLAKTSVVMLPVVLLLLVWWRRGHVAGRDVLRVAPFFALSLALGLVTVLFQQHNPIQEGTRPEAWASRIAASGWIVWFYLFKIVLPINLSMVYPRWDVDGGRVLSFVPLALLIGCFVVLWICRRGWARGPLVGLGYFVIVLLPVLGLINMAFMTYSRVSDHLQYAAMPGVLALIAGLLASVLSRSAARGREVGALAGAVVGGLVIASAVLTWRQARTFKDAEALWDHTIRLNDRAWVAYNNRGVAYHAKGDEDRAMQDFTRALELKPNYAEAYSNRGMAYCGKGKYEQAIQDITKAIALKRDCAEAFNNRGNTYSAMGKYDEAVGDYSEAIGLRPDYADAYNGRGVAYARKGDLNRAIADFTRAIEFRPDDAEAYDNRGNAHSIRGDVDEAIADFTRVIELKPDYAQAYGNRGAALSVKEDYTAAIADFSKLIAIEPDHVEAYANRGVARARTGDLDRAIADFTRVIQLKPDDPEAYNNRAMAYCSVRAYDRAWADVRACRRLGGTPSPRLVQALMDAAHKSE